MLQCAYLSSFSFCSFAIMCLLKSRFRKYICQCREPDCIDIQIYESVSLGRGHPTMTLPLPLFYGNGTLTVNVHESSQPSRLNTYTCVS